MFHVEPEQIESCPICTSREFEKHLSVKDHFYSKEEFQIVKCKGCSFLITNPRPTQADVGSYYNSEQYISHNSNKKSALSAVYRYVRGLNFRTKFACLKQTNKTTLLDYGAGEGMFVQYCHNMGVSSKGFEPSPEARQNALSQGVELLSELPDLKFDNISLWHVLEHVHDLNNTLEKLIALLENNGRLIIAVPNPESFDSKKYGSSWAAYDVPRHLWHFNEFNVLRLIKQHGLKHIETKPLKFDAFYISMLSETYSGRSKLRGLITGLKSNLKAQQGGGYSSQVYIFENCR